jgi:hypothetical protein
MTRRAVLQPPDGTAILHADMTTMLTGDDDLDDEAE